jgi:hypothetical protein
MMIEEEGWIHVILDRADGYAAKVARSHGTAGGRSAPMREAADEGPGIRRWVPAARD